MKKKSFSLKLKTYFSALTVLLMVTGALLLVRFNASLHPGEIRSGALSATLETRVKHLVEIVSQPTFKDELNKISSDLRVLKKESKDERILKAELSLNAVTDVLGARNYLSTDDLFQKFKNIKSIIFNLYRNAWLRHYMNVAHYAGLIMGDLDGVGFLEIEKILEQLYSKVNLVSSVVTGSVLSAQQKVFVLDQISNFKNNLDRYIDALKEYKRQAKSIADKIHETQAHLHAYNQESNKQGEALHKQAKREFYFSLVIFIAAILIAALLWVFFGNAVDDSYQSVNQAFLKSLKNWFSPSGDTLLKKAEPVETMPEEIEEAYIELDRVIQFVSEARRQDLIVKHGINVPFVLIDKSGQAQYWNSKFSQLMKTKSIEETGPLEFTKLLQKDSEKELFQKCLQIKSEIIDEYLAGSELVPVLSFWSPVLNPQSEVEYVFVCFQDLLDEKNKIETEMQKQNLSIIEALKRAKQGHPPENPPAWVHPTVIESLKLIKNLVMENEERENVMSGQLSLATDRLAREAHLKGSVHKRMLQVRSTILELLLDIQRVGFCSQQIGKSTAEFTAMKEILSAVEQALQIEKQSEDTRVESIKEALGVMLSAFKSVHEIQERVREGEKALSDLVEDGVVFTASQTLVSQKRELSPSDILIVTDNIARFIDGFEKQCRKIQTAMQESTQRLAEFEGKFRKESETLRTGLSENGASSAQSKLSILVQKSQTLVQYLAEMSTEIGSHADKLEGRFKHVDDVSKTLVQIAEASRSLHSELEKGFEGLLKFQKPALTYTDDLRIPRQSQ